eukprot:4801689-Heterocapsa_arctica.AAC.1
MWPVAMLRGDFWGGRGASRTLERDTFHTTGCMERHHRALHAPRPQAEAYGPGHLQGLGSKS